MKPRVLYLDVDDTLLIWNNDVHGFGAPGAKEFIEWALEHFEVRWLTMWTLSGTLHPSRTAQLSYRLGHTVSEEVLQNIVNPKGFASYKTNGIDFNDPREWIWVEDEILFKEKQELRDKNLFDRYYKTNVSANPLALQKTWKALAERFDLPGPPDPYPTNVLYPKVILSNSERGELFDPDKWETSIGD